MKIEPDASQLVEEQPENNSSYSIKSSINSSETNAKSDITYITSNTNEKVDLSKSFYKETTIIANEESLLMNIYTSNKNIKKMKERNLLQRILFFQN